MQQIQQIQGSAAKSGVSRFRPIHSHNYCLDKLKNNRGGGLF